MEYPNYYSIIPANVRYDNAICASAKLLYGEITALCNEKGFCWAGNEYFARLYNVSKETISRWIKQLKEKEYIKVKIFFKKDSKEIDKRIISIIDTPIEKNINTPIDENVNTYQQKSQHILIDKIVSTYSQKSHNPIDENVRENNTRSNNINTNNIYSRVIDYLNKKTNKNYKSTTDKTKEKIKARINEGFDIQDFYKVIDIKVSEWLGTDMEKFLRPETLFGNKFEGYLNQNTISNTNKQDDIQYNTDFSEYDKYE